MSDYKCSEQEIERNKVLKYNQDSSKKALESAKKANQVADLSIESTLSLLEGLGMSVPNCPATSSFSRIEQKPVLEEWDDIVNEASQYVPDNVALEDLLTKEEIDNCWGELNEINAEFSHKTSITNKTDLSFLAIATALQVSKSLIFPYVAKQFEYGEQFDASKRLAHDDKTIKEAQRAANDDFRDKYLQNNKAGYWVNILYQTPPYDTTVGSKDLGINMGGKYHRLYTLGHDPILGWLFGTANILTDIITLNNFHSYRVERKPKLRITPVAVSSGTMFHESYQAIQDDALNLPAAIFAQAQHLKSDEFTKVGLPVPILSTFNESFANALYKSQYDALCFARDTKIVGASYVISLMFDIIISLTHNLFKPSDVDQEIYNARTKKILLISNSIASTSTIVNTAITKNPKNLDIGSLISTVAHLFLDMRFIAKLRHEFVEKKIDEKLQKEIDEINTMYDTMKI